MALALIAGLSPLGRVAAADVTEWWAGLGFAGPKMGAVVAERDEGPTGGACVLSVYATSDGGRHWAAPITLEPGPSCSDQESFPLAVTPSGAWFLASSHGLYHGSIGSQSADLLPTGELAPNAPGYAACAITSSGNSVWAVLAKTCAPRGPDADALVARSSDDGHHWASVRAPLSLAGPSIGGAPPDSISASGPTGADLVGWASPGPKDRHPGAEIEVAGTGDGAKTWRSAQLPCGYDDRLSAMVAAHGRQVTAVCLGGAGAGFQAMEVVGSTDGGASWSLRCANGPAGGAPVVSSCPPAGYPTDLAAVSAKTLVMSLGYSGLVDASSDGGRTWKLVLRSAGSFVALSSAAVATWMLGLGPAGPGVRFAETSDGRLWHVVSLPVG